MSKTNGKSKFKVLKCKEFSCPFYHAGIMGSLWCLATSPHKDLEHGQETPPDWCPLRVSPITVKL